MDRRNIIPTLLLAALLVTIPLVHAATTGTTTFTFRVPTTKSISITYGGNCNSSAFFFSEMDARFDPDTDGNAAKVKPNSTRGVFDLSERDINFVGVTSPSLISSAYGYLNTGHPPSVNNTPSTELNDGNYINVSADDTLYFNPPSTVVLDNHPSFRAVFKTDILPQNVTDLNFFYLGDSLSGAACPTGNGKDRDINLLVWNHSTAAYELLDFVALGGTLPNQTGFDSTILTGVINTNVQNYVSWDGNIVALIQAEESTGVSVMCLITDFIDLEITGYQVPTSFCQSSTLAPMTISNTGNVDINVDGNFSSAFSGVDTNLVLKVWMGTGSGCGIDGNGLGGWEKDCSVTDTTAPVTATTCKNYNSSNATTGSRLISNLIVGDTNQLCFSGDFNGVGAGDHNKIFQAGSEYS